MSGEAKSRMDRIIRLHEEIDSIKADIREVYAEEKADGGDKTAMGAAISIIRKREKDRTAFDDREAMVDVYLNAYASPSHTHAREAGQSYAEAKGVERTTPEASNTKAPSVFISAFSTTQIDTQEQPVTASQSETADQVREVPTVTSAEPVEPSANEYAGTSSDENPATDATKAETMAGFASVQIPHSPADLLPGKADKTSEAVTPPAVSLVANSDDDVPAFLRKQSKPLRPHCLNPDLCAGSGSKHCYSCLKARDEALVTA